jgi:hypothetical protein
MEVTPVEEEEVFDLVNDSLEGSVARVVAVDITFYVNDEIVEPTQPINVKMIA